MFPEITDCGRTDQLIHLLKEESLHLIYQRVSQEFFTVKHTYWATPVVATTDNHAPHNLEEIARHANGFLDKL